VSQVLKPVVALYAMKVIETNLGWYMSEGLLSTQVGTAVPQHIRYSSVPSWKEREGNIENPMPCDIIAGCCWQISRTCFLTVTAAMLCLFWSQHVGTVFLIAVHLSKISSCTAW